MNWPEVISQGGGWVIAMAVGYAVLTGRLRLGREVEERDRRIEDLTTTYEKATTKLEAAAGRETDSLKASLAVAEQRVADIGARFDRFIDGQQGPNGGTA